MHEKLKSARPALDERISHPSPRKVGIGSPSNRICTLGSSGVVTVVAEATSNCREPIGVGSERSAETPLVGVITGQVAKWKQQT